MLILGGNNMKYLFNRSLCFWGNFQDNLFKIITQKQKSRSTFMGLHQKRCHFSIRQTSSFFTRADRGKQFSIQFPPETLEILCPLKCSHIHSVIKNFFHHESLQKYSPVTVSNFSGGIGRHYQMTLPFTI